MKKLTEAEAKRINEIREQMAALDKEASAIVAATEDEIQMNVEMYSDGGSWDWAEMIAGSWGAWEDVLSNRLSHRDAADEEESEIATKRPQEVSNEAI